MTVEKNLTAMRKFWNMLAEIKDMQNDGALPDEIKDFISTVDINIGDLTHTLIYLSECQITHPMEASAAAMLKTASPKTEQGKQARVFMLDCYDNWLSWKQNPTQFKSKTKFIEAQLEDSDIKTNPRTIENWCRDWDAGFDPRVAPRNFDEAVIFSAENYIKKQKKK